MSSRKFIELILDGYDLENKDSIIKNCETLFSDPELYANEHELDWLWDSEPEQVCNVAVPLELQDVLISGDKIDEIHERIVEMGISMPDFPDGRNFTAKEYFAWVASYLKEEKLELLHIGNSLSDELYLVMVWMDNTDEILRLAQELFVSCERPSTYLY